MNPLLSQPGIRMGPHANTGIQTMPGRRPYAW
jgi:hypothetical protein